MKTTHRSGSDDGKNGTRYGPATVEELATVLEMTRRGAQEKATREGWLSKEGARGRGKAGQCDLEVLPGEIRDAILVHRNILPDELKGCEPEAEDGDPITECIKRWTCARDWQKKRARARKELLESVERFCEHFRGPEGVGIKRFARLFNDGQEIPGIDADVRAEIKTISPRTIYGWRHEFRKHGIAGLLSGHGKNRGESGLPEDQKDFVIGKMYGYPHKGPKPIWKGLVARYGGKAGSKWQVASFMKNTRKRHPGHWLYVRSPKSWKNTVQAAPGSASEKAQHFMHFGEMDSTPADVICNDGKRYAIIGFIDVYSRKVMFEVAPTSNQWAIRALLWRLWGTFGVPENLTVDHGKDYQAKSLHEAFACVGTRTAWIAPFAPESKGHIERMFRTVAEGLFEILPGFCGHNVTQRQEIREREKLYKRLCKRGEQVAVPLSPDELQQKLDQWTEYVYHQETHSGKGMKMSPNAKASLSPRQATIISDPADRTRLLAPNEERLVAKDGVHYNGRIYWADKLGPLIRNKVRVHQNMWDVSWVYCSDLETGEPICVAEDGSKSGKRRTPAEARQAKKIQKQERDAFMRLLNIKAKLNCSDPLEDAIVATRHQGGTIHNLSKGKEFENPFRYWPRDMTAGQIGHPETGVSEIKEEAFAEAEAGREPTAGRPRLCLVDAPQDSDLDELRFASSNDLFDYIMAKRQQKRGLTTTEETRLRETLPYWERYARLRIETLPRGDQVFLAKIAPESFGEYAEDEAVGGSH